MHNAQSDRAAVAIIKKAYEAKGKNPILTASTLRLEQLVTVNKTVYQFPILENEIAGNDTEIRLNTNDAFTITSIGLFIGVAAAGDKTDTEFELLPYPDKGILTTAGAAKAAKAIYNGKLKMTVNGTIYLQNWHLGKHLYVPITQFSATTDPSIKGNDGFVSCTPFVNLSGGNKNVIEISLTKSVSTIQAGADTRLVLLLDGYLATNAASFQV